MTTLLRTAPTTILDELAAQARPLAMDNVDRSFEVRVYDPDAYDFVASERFHLVELSQGQLRIDGRAIPSPRFGPRFVTFCVTDGATNLSGVLDFTPDAAALTGTVFASSPGQAAEAMQVVGVAPRTTYETRLGTTGATPPQGQKFPAWSPPAPSAWAASVEVTQTYTFVNTKVPTPVFEIAGHDVTDFTAAATDPTTGCLLFAVDIPDAIVAEYIAEMGPKAPVSMTIQIAESGKTFVGAARTAVPSSDGTYTKSGDWFAFEGTWNQQPQTGGATGSAATPAVADLGGQATFSAVTSGGVLGISQLYTMQVDPGQLQQDQFNALVENMKWALGQDPDPSLLAFFGELPPDLPSERTDLIKQDLSYYTGSMATSYLGGPINAMSGDSGPTTHLTDDQFGDLQFYLRAGLPKSPAFARQTQGVFLTAFTEAATGLSDYIADQQANTVGGKIDPAHDWGAQLLDQVTTPAQLNMTYNGVNQGFGLSNFHRYTSLLLALDPSGTYATRYHQAFLSRSLGASIEHLQLTDASATATWLEAAITAIITNFPKDGPANPQIDPATAALLRELSQELDDAVEHIGSAAGLARALADLAVAAQAGKATKDFWGALQAAQTAWGKAGYVFARAIYVIAILGGLLAAIVSFINWDKLTKPQQGEAVTATVETAAKIVESVREIWSGEWGFEQSGQTEIALSDSSLTQPLLEPYATDQLQDATGGIADMADGEAGTLDTTGTKWGELFTSFDGVMSVIGAAAAVALAVLSTVTFIEDIIDHASVSTTVIDGVIMAANYAVAIAAVVSILSAAAAVPIVGAIAAAIGVVVALISMLIPKPKPETPAEKFMEGYLIPAIAGPGRWILPSPAGWTSRLPIPTTNAYNPASSPTT